MAKEIAGYVKLQIKGGQANPAPPVGPALGQRGINIMEFCKAFNEKTKAFMGKPVPVVITVYKDKKFDFIIKSPPFDCFKFIFKDKSIDSSNFVVEFFFTKSIASLTSIFLFLTAFLEISLYLFEFFLMIILLPQYPLILQNHK